MTIAFWIFYTIISLYIGLFISILAVSLSDKECEKSIFGCYACKHKLSFIDSVPIFSFLFFRGKCRYCKSKIPYIYLLGEVLTLIIFIVIAISISGIQELIIAYSFAIIMILAVLSDLKYQIIPNKITYFGISLFLFIRIFIHPLPLWSYLLGAVIGSGILLLLAIVSKGGMGGGDIKLFVVIGLVLGWQDTILALFLSIMAGGILSILLLLFKIIDRKQMIPFGPFIFIGTMITYFFGTEIWSWYLW